MFLVVVLNMTKKGLPDYAETRMSYMKLKIGIGKGAGYDNGRKNKSIS